MIATFEKSMEEKVAEKVSATLERKTNEALEVALNEKFAQAEWSLARRLEQAQAATTQHIQNEHDKRDQMELLKAQRESQQFELQIGEIGHRFELRQGEMHRHFEKQTEDTSQQTRTQNAELDKKLQEASAAASQDVDKLQSRLEAAEQRLSEVDAISIERHTESQERHRQAEERAATAENRAADAESRAEASMKRALEAEGRLTEVAERMSQTQQHLVERTNNVAGVAEKTELRVKDLSEQAALAVSSVGHASVLLQQEVRDVLNSERASLQAAHGLMRQEVQVQLEAQEQSVNSLKAELSAAVSLTREVHKAAEEAKALAELTNTEARRLCGEESNARGKSVGILSSLQEEQAQGMAHLNEIVAQQGSQIQTATTVTDNHPAVVDRLNAVEAFVANHAELSPELQRLHAATSELRVGVSHVEARVNAQDSGMREAVVQKIGELEHGIQTTVMDHLDKLSATREELLDQRLETKAGYLENKINEVKNIDIERLRESLAQTVQQAAVSCEIGAGNLVTTVRAEFQAKDREAYSRHEGLATSLHEVNKDLSTLTEGLDALRQRGDREASRASTLLSENARAWEAKAASLGEEISQGAKKGQRAFETALQGMEGAMNEVVDTWERRCKEHETQNRSEVSRLAANTEEEFRRLRREVEADRSKMMAQVDVQLASAKKGEHERLRGTMLEHESLILDELKKVCEESLVTMEALTGGKIEAAVSDMRSLTAMRCDHLEKEINAVRIDLRKELEEVTIPMVANYVLLEHAKKGQHGLNSPGFQIGGPRLGSLRDSGGRTVGESWGGAGSPAFRP